MIQISALAKSIEDELNGSLNAVALDIKFKIHATMGNYIKATTKVSGKKQVYINGILRTTTGTYTPVKSLNNVDATLMLELAVQQEQVDDVQLILSTWTEGVVGEVYTMGNWAVLITPQTSIAGIAKNASPIGSMIPLMLMLDMQFIQNGLVSNSVTWKINGETVNPTNVATTNTRSPDTNPRANLGVVKNTNQYDNETIVMTLPISFSTIIQNILNDVRGHLIDAVYRITRQDNFSDNLDALYSLTNAELVEEGGKIAAITLTFNPADLDATGFILRFNSDGGNDIAPKEVYYGKAIGGLSTPRRAGYVFDGWYVDGNLITEDTICNFNEDKIAVAYWYSKGLVFTYLENDDAYLIGTRDQDGSGLNEDWEGGALIIPTKFKGKNVIEIAVTAFYKFGHNFNITSVSLPNNLVTIGRKAFQNTNIISLNIPNSVVAIGVDAFSGCTNLVSVTLPNNLEELEGGIFAGCTNLSQITLPSTLKKIKSFAFYECSSLTSINLPNGLTHLEGNVFSRTGLTSVTIPNLVVYAGGGIFNFCPLTEINVYMTNLSSASKVTQKNNSWFLGVSSSTKIHIPTSVVDPSTAYGAEFAYVATGTYLTYEADLT